MDFLRFLIHKRTNAINTAVPRAWARNFGICSTGLFLLDEFRAVNPFAKSLDYLQSYNRVGSVGKGNIENDEEVTFGKMERPIAFPKI